MNFSEMRIVFLCSFQLKRLHKWTDEDLAEMIEIRVVWYCCEKMLIKKYANEFSKNAFKNSIY